MRAHRNAVKARLAESPLLDGIIHAAVRRRGEGEFVRENYVVLWTTAPDGIEPVRYTQLGNGGARATYTFEVRVVAVDDDGCAQLAEAVIAQLAGHTLTVPGRSLHPTEFLEGGDVEYEPKPDLFYCDLSFRVVSDPE